MARQVLWTLMIVSAGCGHERLHRTAAFASWPLVAIVALGLVLPFGWRAMRARVADPKARMAAWCAMEEDDSRETEIFARRREAA
jgi:hypothetical protein